MVMSQLIVLSACALGVDGAAVTKSAHSAQLKLVEALATNKVNGKDIDETIKNELRELITNELTEAKKQIVDGHKADKQERNELVNNYDTQCKDVFTTKQSGYDNEMAATVKMMEGTHKTCRTVTLFNADAKQTDECDEIVSINNGIRSSAAAISAPAGRNTQEWETFWADVKALLSQETSQVDGEAECVSAEDARAKAVKDCNFYQAGYEDKFCLVRERKDKACSAYDTCYDQFTADLNTVVTETSVGEATRKVEWESVHKIECFINVILGENGATADQDGLTACKNKGFADFTVPEGGDGLTLPTVTLGDELNCDMTTVATYPCVPDFVAKYDGWLDVAECDACAALESEALQTVRAERCWSQSGKRGLTEQECRDYATATVGDVATNFVGQWITYDKGCIHYDGEHGVDVRFNTHPKASSLAKNRFFSVCTDA